MTFSEKLRFLRRQKRVTQQAFADAIGISKRTLIGWEIDGRHPRDRDILHKIAAYFDVDVNYLLVETEPVETDGRAIFQARAVLEEARTYFAGNLLTAQEKLQFLQDIQTLFVDSYRNCENDL